MTDQTARPGPADKLRKPLDQPFVGFAPWILPSVVGGPDRLVPAAVHCLAPGLNRPGCGPNRPCAAVPTGFTPRPFGDGVLSGKPRARLPGPEHPGDTSTTAADRRHW